MPAPDILERSESAERVGRLESTSESLILLVDSDPSSVEFMARALTQSDMRVVVADRISGAGGAAMQLRTNPGINVVVIDPQAVPGRDSLADLREAGLRDDAEVILVAEPITLARYAQSARAEIADFLPKPVARRTLLRAVLEAQKRHVFRSDSPSSEQKAPGSEPIDRLVQRLAEPPAKRLSTKDPSGELKLLQWVEDLDECRASALPGIVETDASWSMLSELLRAHVSRRRVSVTSLCLASKSPVTTALRRIERLLETGFITYSLDPKDRRRKYIELTDDGATKVQDVVRGIARHFAPDEPFPSPDP